MNHGRVFSNAKLYKHYEIVDFLNKKVKKNVTDEPIGISPHKNLFDAVLIEDKQKLKKLLSELRCNVHIPKNEKKQTLLHVACLCKFESIVELLLDQKLLVEKDKETGVIPLLLCVQIDCSTNEQLLNDRSQILKYIVKKILNSTNDCQFLAIIKSMLSDFDKQDDTPLHIASRNGYVEICKQLLLLAGECISSHESKTSTSQSQTVEVSDALRNPRSDEHTPPLSDKQVVIQRLSLSDALHQQQPAILSSLLLQQHRQSVIDQGYLFQSMLMGARLMNSSSAIVSKRMKLLILKKNGEKRSSIHEAILQNRIEIVQLFFKSPSSKNQQQQPLDDIQSMNQTDLEEILDDYDGIHIQTCLHMAAREGSIPNFH
ncbi:unnamed protein product [Didymodactylos carnosus]|uniref:Uncharacterized protein n=1 Tax=Didymodactylos carnosus TaxID=1234261 RepID=A0A8S2N503_9BILA|nr:unnamed protein product [Didymodactylos carnosus]CAF3976904.1 unnamed protein product [Didymodactylos carnosus]